MKRISKPPVRSAPMDEEWFKELERHVMINKWLSVVELKLQRDFLRRNDLPDMKKFPS
jgi:hypothetical protein